MSKPFISYLVTCKNEGKQLQPLLDLLFLDSLNAECVILDDYSDDVETLNILDTVSKIPFYRVEKHHLNKNYGEHKNYGKSLCRGKYIFQIDADEIPSETLLVNLRDILNLNPEVELFWVSRINDFVGVNDEYARKWGWRLTDYNGKRIVNWPDPQTRIFKNLPEIRWEKRLHERVVGAKVISQLPFDYDLSLIHNKTMAKQEESNNRYMRDFSVSENRGG